VTINALISEGMKRSFESDTRSRYKSPVDERTEAINKEAYLSVLDIYQHTRCVSSGDAGKRADEATGVQEDVKEAHAAVNKTVLGKDDMIR
jgi:hypothetical protein